MESRDTAESAGNPLLHPPPLRCWFARNRLNWTANIHITYYIDYTYLHIKPESGQHEQCVTFSEPTEECTIEEKGSVPDPLRSLKGESDASLAHFLSRPTRVYSADWTTAGSLFSICYPWAVFTGNAKIVNRLTNFKLIRCNLHIKVVLNGNSFYYGRLMVSYHPLYLMDEYASNETSFKDSVRPYQMQHILCDPSQSSGGEMVLPFTWDCDYMDVPNINSNTTNIGALNIRTLVPLAMATETAATRPVSVSIYAWAEDVELGGLTSTNASSIIPQSGSDEYTGGPISRIANTVKAIADPLAASPIVGSYARATSVAAGSVAAVAQLFGYSRPTDVEEPSQMKPKPISNLATTMGPDGSTKLTMDPKQEVSIDPAILGSVVKDELSINRIAGIDSLFAQFQWDFSDGTDTMLYNTMVDPCIYYKDTNCYLPACCGVTLPFEYWSGSLEYTFEFVCSAYHRGRVAIVYDPHQTPASYTTNVNYQQIVDISECRKFTVRIGNNQPQALRRRYRPGESDTYLPNGGHGATRITYANITNAGSIGNGTISVFVVNELTSPTNLGTGITVLMSVRACEDFRVYQPGTGIYNFSYVIPESGVEPIKTKTVESCAKFVVDIKGDTTNSPKVYMGEQILSIRSLLKRYTAYRTYEVSPTVDTNLTRFEHCIYPLHYLYAQETVDSPVINFVGHTYISYFRCAFATIRGGTRWKIVPLTPPPAGGTTSSIMVMRVDNPVTSQGCTEVVLTAGSSTLPRSGLIAMQKSYGGTVLTCSSVNPCVEFEVPFYSNRRFLVGPSCQETVTGYYAPGFRVLSSYQALGERFQTYVAAAEDFTMAHFIGFPPMVYHSVIPAAT